jgi:hypothetical protein
MATSSASCRRDGGGPAASAARHGACLRNAGSRLDGRLRGYRAAIAPDGMIWVSWPKKYSGVATDLTDVVVRDTALRLGLVDIKVGAIDEIWSGLKFVIPKEQRKNEQPSKPDRRVKPPK